MNDDAAPDASRSTTSARPRATAARRRSRSPSRDRCDRAAGRASTSRPRTARRPRRGDYAATSGTLTFAPGETDARRSRSSVNGDTTFEANETFFVNLVEPDRRDDRATARASARSRTTTRRRRSRSTTSAWPRATAARRRSPSRSRRPARPSCRRRVDFATANGTATAARRLRRRQRHAHLRPGRDERRRSRCSSTATPTFEANETFLVNLTNAVAAPRSPTARASARSTNDDAAPALSDRRRRPGRGQQRHDGVHASPSTLTGATELPATVDFATADGTATAPGDYAPAQRHADLRPGRDRPRRSRCSSTATRLRGGRDLLRQPLEPDRRDDRRRPGRRHDRERRRRSDASRSTTSARPRATPGRRPSPSRSRRPVPTELPATVDFATANGTATAPGDYAAGSGTLTFAPGETTQARSPCSSTATSSSRRTRRSS